VARLPVGLRVDDRVDRDRRLAGLAVADDELTLATTDRDHRVDGLDAGLQRLVDRLALHDARGLELEGAAARGLDLAEAVDRLAQRVDDAAEVAVTDGDREDLARATDLLALLDPRELTEDDDADLPDVEVEREAERAVLELQQLVGHAAGQALDLRDAVGGEGDPADLLARVRRGLVGRDEAVQRCPDLLGLDRQLRQCSSPVLSGLARQPASRRRTSSMRDRTVAFTTSDPTSMRRPPTTPGSTLVLSWTSRP